MTSEAPLLSLRQIVKDFGDLRANDRVDFEVARGEIHALLGENGAGKTTLMNIAAGRYRSTSGEIAIKGRSATIKSPRDAIALGVGMVHQQFHLVERLTVAQNVTLGWHTPQWLLRPKVIEAETRIVAERFGFDIDPSRLVWQLSVGERQRVELLKALYRDAVLLILDEPTAVLAPQDADLLFLGLRRVVNQGRGVVLITHRLNEVLRYADRVTVLRRGRRVATMPLAGVSADDLALWMIGDALPTGVEREPVDSGDVVLNLRGVEARDAHGRVALDSIDLIVRAGEIVGIAGVAGNGQSPLAEAIAGLRPVTRGRVELNGADVTHATVRQRIDRGLAFCPEERAVGAALELPILSNLIAKSYRKPPIGGRMLLDRGAARRRATQLVEDFDIRGAAIDAPMSALSGGNAQKVVLAREFSTEPHVIVASHPTRGLDIAAAGSMRRLLADRRREGCGVLLIGEDLDELIEMSDRLIVLSRGRITGEFSSDDVDPQRLGIAMAGGR
ncbi:MAG: ABC transporter ATP-binding protein [Actinomycetota bacterium]